MSQSKRHSSNFEEDRELAEREVREITAQLKRTRQAEESRVPPSILGWILDCPHCHESLKLTYGDRGTHELTVE